MQNEFKAKTQLLIQKLKEELSAIRTNRPTPALVENIKVDCYDGQMPIKEIGSISVTPPREIRIQLWDTSIIENVVKALDNAPTGFSTKADGNIVHVNLPELSGERREELVKHVKKETEGFRIRLRTLREEHNKKIQNSGEPEDAQSRLKKEVQTTTDETNKEIETILENKIVEIQQ